MADNENVQELKIKQLEKKTDETDKRTSKHEDDINTLNKSVALFEQRFELLIKQLIELPTAVTQMKDTMISMQNENKNLITLIQNENSNMLIRVESLESKLENSANAIRKSMENEIEGIRDKIKLDNNVLSGKVEKIETRVDVIDEDSKFNITKFIREQFITIILAGGTIVFLIPKLIEMLTK